MIPKIVYVSDFTEGGKIDNLINEIKWVDDQFARRECFMSDVDREYQYIENGPVYKSLEFHPLVKELMLEINKDFGYRLDVCFLNYYTDGKKEPEHLRELFMATECEICGKEFKRGLLDRKISHFFHKHGIKIKEN